MFDGSHIAGGVGTARRADSNGVLYAHYMRYAHSEVDPTVARTAGCAGTLRSVR